MKKFFGFIIFIALVFCAITFVPDMLWTFEFEPKASLEEYTWAEIYEIAGSGMPSFVLSSKYNIKVGDTKDGYILVDDDANKYAVSGFIFMGQIKAWTNVPMKEGVNKNEGGYGKSALVSKLEQYYSTTLINTEFGAELPKVTVKYITHYNNNALSDVKARLFLPSLAEVNGRDSEDIMHKWLGGEGEAFDYFAKDPVTQRAAISNMYKLKNNWWLRSIYDEREFCSVKNNGLIENLPSSKNGAVLVAFVIGS